MKSLHRREFIKRSLTASIAASVFPSIAPSSVLGADGQVSPNNKINVACIGVGPQGRGVMSGFLHNAKAHVTVVCDVSDLNRNGALKQVNDVYKNTDCQTSKDFREVITRKDIDAVVIATPDHWHVPIAIAAAKAGKDMYLEKPMGLSLQEDQMLRKIMQEKRLIFQFGTQQRSDAKFRKACELVRNGKIGKLKKINVWCSANRPGGPTAPIPAPEGLDYEFWLGPAPKTPYTAGKAFDNIPPGQWKTWWFNYDYALGFIAGWGVHPLDIALWGHPEMMTGPMDVEGKAIIPTEGACNTATAWDVQFQFHTGVALQFRGTPNGAPPCELNDLSAWKSKYDHIADHGTAFEGTDGWVIVDRRELRTSPDKLVEEKFDDFKVRLTRSTHHAANFLDCVASRKPAICPIEDSVQADLLCHLSDIASRAQKKLQFDPVKEQFINNPDANKKLELRPMRDPWKLTA